MNEATISYAEQAEGAARFDLANAALKEHLADCPCCDAEPYGFCPIALAMIANPPELQPQNN